MEHFSLIFIIFTLLLNFVLCNFITKYQIKHNISLFYALHKDKVDKIIEDKKEDDLIEKI